MGDLFFDLVTLSARFAKAFDKLAAFFGGQPARHIGLAGGRINSYDIGPVGEVESPDIQVGLKMACANGFTGFEIEL